MISTDINDILRAAIGDCHNTTHEEEGGVITVRNGEYRWTHLPNKLTGTSEAIHLYEIDKEVYTRMVVTTFATGWRVYGSFHTHPQFANFPSNIDVNYLFKGFKHNYIHSFKDEETALYTRIAKGWGKTHVEL